MAEGFKTPDSVGHSELVVLRSRFLGVARPVRDQEECEVHLARLRARYPDASHIVFAFRVGRDRGVLVERYSDDGEPSGTGGPPLLDMLQNRGLHHALVAVTRYFGGTKLGTGGLARAYGEAGQLALEEAGLAHRVPCQLMHLEVPYTNWGKASAYISERRYPQRDAAFSHVVTTSVWVPLNDRDSFTRDMAEISAGNIGCTPAEEAYLPRRRGRLEGDNCWTY